MKSFMLSVAAACFACCGVASERGSAGRSAGDFVIQAGGGVEGIETARAAVRAMKRERPDETITVLLPKGEIALTETLVFGPEDSGSPGAPVVWKGDGTVIRGGVDVGPWTAEGGGVVSAPIPVGATDGRSSSTCCLSMACGPRARCCRRTARRI